MFTPHQIKRAAFESAGIEIHSDETWSALKEYADTIRGNPWLSSPMMGGIVPAPGSAAMAKNGTDEAYLLGGMFQGTRVAKEIEQYANLNNPLDILDFGCGVARLTRFFKMFWPQHNYLACDVNMDAVNFINKSIPGIEAFGVDPMPPMNIPDESLDVVYAWSVWTHFSKEASIDWLHDVKRVLRPGGLAIVTVHNDEIVDRYGNEPMLVNRMAERGGNYSAIRKSYDETGYAFWQAYPKEAGIDPETFGMVFTSRNWIAENWGNILDVKRYGEGVRGWQDVLTLQKPA